MIADVNAPKTPIDAHIINNMPAAPSCTALSDNVSMRTRNSTSAGIAAINNCSNDAPEVPTWIRPETARTSRENGKIESSE